MLSDTGGNTGSQSSTMVIRALATGDIKISDIWKVVFKEGKVGLIAGLALGFVNFIRLFFLVKESFLISLLVSLTILCVVELSKIMGAFLPIVVKKLGFDPALMASSFISTVIDSCALIIYFGLANLILY